ncbi:hypothetical protein EZV62_014618 [Acer yangbiense]|uniref:Uncharacterized protein n=1 Tax=Acer yangbiense TaxID=1000413 RepID=A0A5C7HTB6_9ROSI|nr:hypothetical protein EZV62_014618 [Acer yangbiense]
MNLTSINDDDLDRGAGPSRVSYDNLDLATNNFSGERKLAIGSKSAGPVGRSSEMAIGSKSAGPVGRSSEMGMVEWVWDLYGSGNLLSAVDERLDKVFDSEEVKCLMIVGTMVYSP